MLVWLDRNSGEKNGSIWENKEIELIGLRDWPEVGDWPGKAQPIISSKEKQWEETFWEQSRAPL